MQWRGLRGSGNIEDRRGVTGTHLAFGGVGGIIVYVLYLFLGGNPSQLEQGIPQQTTQEQKAADDSISLFVSAVLGNTEDVWKKVFTDMGESYVNPHLVMFTQSTQSGCGFASEASGPFYCPQDEKVYLDISFFQEMKNRFRAPGDFAMAYVVAHEVGHHVQKLLGIMDKIDAQRSSMSEANANRLSVKLELQADFFAGVWAHYAQAEFNIVDEGDIEEALNAANAIGDDRLQKQSQGYVVPDAFTHGTSAQRMYWFKKGFTTGDINQGDTFNDRSL